ncbi:MAG: FHA domain-containing protein [Bacteroidetes bacterium]|nr:FHA domain-containing protein [Bacteroidota bacterium]
MTDSTVAGWLIVHTEGKQMATHPLKAGKNYIGRTTAGYKPDIPVEQDKYVSRHHALLNVRLENNQYRYILTDNASNAPEGGKKSTNGTFVNGNPERLPEDRPVILKDKDTVQIGETKLVLKTAEYVVNLDDAVKQVENMDYEKSVVISELRDKQEDDFQPQTRKVRIVKRVRK